MASEESLSQAQFIIPYVFQDINLLRKALTAGDTNSPDREGNRGLAQVGDALMSIVIRTEGFRRGLSRRELEEHRSIRTNKAVCSVRATALRLTPLVRISERQKHEGPQPNTLRDALAAIVAAVWLDSQMQYDAAVGIMGFLGLVNHSGSYTEPEEPDAANWELTFGNDNAIHNDDSANKYMLSERVDSDSFLDTDLLGPGCTLVSHDTDRNLEWFTTSMLPLSNETSRLPALERDDMVEMWPGADVVHLDIPTLTVAHVQSETSPACGAQAVAGSPPDIRMYHKDIQPAEDWSDLSRFQRIEKKSTSTSGCNLAKRRNPTKRNEIRLAFKAYLSHEAEKLKLEGGIFAEYYGHMDAYQETLLSINTSSSKAIANMALGIGDCSAMQVLKQAIESIRAPTGEGLLRVRQEMSCKERLDAIYNLDLCMANLRIARWLHIYKLYEEMSTDVSGQGADGFIVLTSADLGQSATQSRTLATKGNPRNLERATITKRMMDHLESGSKTGTDRKKSESSMKRLRRLGHRLRLLVNRWGIGVLCLLGADFNDELLMSVADNAFTESLEVVDRFEGTRIQVVSETAVAAVQLFMDEYTSSETLRIETIEQEALGRLPRLSLDMQELFKATGAD